MADAGFGGEIVVATTNTALASEVRRLGGARIGTSIEHVELQPSHLSRRLSAFLGSVVPAHKLLIYGDNLTFFRGLDVLVVAEKTSLILKKRYGLTNLGIVHTRHGAGDIRDMIDGRRAGGNADAPGNREVRLLKVDAMRHHPVDAAERPSPRLIGVWIPSVPPSWPQRQARASSPRTEGVTATSSTSIRSATKPASANAARKPAAS